MNKLLARDFRSNEAICVEYEAGTIVSVRNAPADLPGNLPFIAPAFFDLQINGAKGISFNSPTLTVEQVATVIQTCQSHGIAEFCPTLITNSAEALIHGFQTICRARTHDSQIASAIPCFHLEGPYISIEDGPRGAHPRSHVRRPDLEEFLRLQDAADGLIRLVTLSPEWPNSIDFISKITKQGVIVALGHMNATTSQIHAAIDAGARLSTHLGNGCHASLPRHPNYIWDQLAADDLMASIITDGHHLPDSVVKSIVRIKSPENTILTCDASSLAGMPPGYYEEWGSRIEVQENGKVVLSGTSFLAGSGVFLDRCVRNATEICKIPLAQVIDMATNNPRRLLRLEERHLKVGEPADFLIYESNKMNRFDVRSIVIKGQTVRGQLS